MKPDELCAYCLDEADGFDHLMPVSRQTNRRRRGKMASLSERVPCCTMCNSLLGDCPAFTVRDRAAVLLLRYAERPRSEAIDTHRKIKHLFEIVAGFDLGKEIERIDESQRRRFAAEMEAKRLEEEAEAAEELRKFEEEVERRVAGARAMQDRIADRLAWEAEEAEAMRLKRAQRPRIRRRNLPCQPYSLTFEPSVSHHGFHIQSCRFPKQPDPLLGPTKTTNRLVSPFS